jgi:hypothetical protein
MAGGETASVACGDMRGSGGGIELGSAPIAALRKALQLLGFGIIAVPASAFAQTAEVTLPEVRVIGTTPLSTVRTARPRAPVSPGRRTVPAGPAAPALAAPAAEQATATDPGLIDRYKVPSNTVTLTSEDFDRARYPSLADSLL